MKDAEKNMEAILRRIKKNGCVLMLDFDGVLSPIVKIPSKARISPAARSALSVCANKMPVAIISGRTLSDIERRAALKNVIYAGSHGLEWRMNGRVYRKKISRNALSAFAAARRSLLRHAKPFPGLFIEDKRHCLALGYRSLTSAQTERFLADAYETVKKFFRTRTVRIMDNLYTFELMMASEWTKGECARHIFKTTAKKGVVAVYIGDSLTDEDAFRVLSKNGVTIRIGKLHTSEAQYYFKSRSMVDRFLRNIANQT